MMALRYNLEDGVSAVEQRRTKGPKSFPILSAIIKRRWVAIKERGGPSGSTQSHARSSVDSGIEEIWGQPN